MLEPVERHLRQEPTTLMDRFSLCLLLLLASFLRADTIHLGPDFTTAEGDGAAILTLTRTGNAPLPAISIDLSTRSQTAGSPEDFIALDHRTVTFPAGATQTTVSITLIDDLNSECEETFQITVVDANGHAISGGDVTISIEASDLLTLPQHDGSTDAPPPGSPFLITEMADRGVFCYRTVIGNLPLWRTRLTVITGEAHLELKRGSLNAAVNPDFLRKTPGSDGIVLHRNQFRVSEEWFLRVHITAPNTSFSLFTGAVHVRDQGILQDDRNYSGPAFSGLVFPPEEALFFTAQVPAGARAWSLWAGGYRKGEIFSQIAVRKNQPGLPVSQHFDFVERNQTLLVPPYLGSGADTYYVSMQGVEGESLDLHSHLIKPSNLAADSTLTDVIPTFSGAPYRIYQVEVPVSFIAWDHSLRDIDFGDPNLAVRKGEVPSRWVNDAFSESVSAEDSLTLVPPILTSGTWYVTVYGDDAFQTDLVNGSPETTGALVDIDFLDEDTRSIPPLRQPGPGAVSNPVPSRAGWSFYRADKIAEQNGLLGWDLTLNGALPETEIAIRQNAVPSRIRYRNASRGVLSTSNVGTRTTNFYDAVSSLGFLQRPSQQADVWYVGVYRAEQALGNFQLQRDEITPVPVSPDGNESTVTGLQPAAWQFFRFDLQDGILGWQSRLLEVSSGGAPRLVIRRAALPARPIGSPVNVANFANGVAISSNTDFFPTETSQSRRAVILPNGDPLVTDPTTPITYYAGIYNDGDSPVDFTFKSTILDEDSIPYAGAQQTPELAFTNGQESIRDLPAGESLFFKVRVPVNASSWRFRLQNVSGDARAAVRAGFIPDYSASVVNGVISQGGVQLARSGSEIFQLLPENNAPFLSSGDYFIAVTAERDGPFSGTLISEGELGVTDLGTPAPVLSAAYALPGDEIGLYTFTLPAGALAVQISLEETGGKADLSLRFDSLSVRPSSHPNGSFGYGYDGGNSADQQQDSVITLQSPGAGVYSLTLRAERSQADRALPASGTLEIRILSAAPLSPESSQTVGNHPPRTWRYFETYFSSDGRLSGDSSAILAWQARLTGITNGNALQVAVAKGEAPPAPVLFPRTAGFLTGNPSRETSWPDGATWVQASSIERKPTADNTPTNSKSFLAAWEKPLDGGHYIIGIFNPSSTDTASYTLESRTVGEPGSSSSLPVTDLSFSGGAAIATGIAPRDFRVYRVTTPAAGAASLRIQLAVDHGESLLAVRSGFVPDARGSATLSVGSHPDDGMSNTGGGMRVEKLGAECYHLFPGEGEDLLPANREYYLLALSEGSGASTPARLGAQPSSFTLTSEGEVPRTTVTFNNGLYQRALNLKSAEVRLFEFTVPVGTSSLEVELSNLTGNDAAFALRSGPLIPTAHSTQNTYAETYGINGGTRADSVLQPSLATIATPTPGLYTLAIRTKSNGVTSWASNTTADLRIQILGPQTLAFCSGSATQNAQPPRSWRYFNVTVPENAAFLAWDIRIAENYQGGRPTLSIRRDALPTRTPAPPYQSRILPWVSGRQLQATTADYTGDTTRSGDGASLSATRDILPFGELLVPGNYVVGVFNESSTEASSYTVLSRCIGLPDSGADHIVLPLPVINGSASATVASREAAYFSLEVPPNTLRNLVVRLAVTAPGDSCLVVNKGFIPTSRGGERVDADTVGSSGIFRRVGDDVFTLLPEDGDEYLDAATYYLALASQGGGRSRNEATPGTATVTVTTTALPDSTLGGVGAVGSSLTAPINLPASEMALYRFTVPTSVDPENVIEIRLQNRSGLGTLSLRADSLIPRPGSLLLSQQYGYDKGSRPLAEGRQILTMVNLKPGDYTLNVTAASSEANPVDTTAELVVANVGLQDLAFSSVVATAQLPSSRSASLLDGQKIYYQVQVPPFITFLAADSGGELAQDILLPVEAWKLTLAESLGDARLRVMKVLSGNGSGGGSFTQPSTDDIAIVSTPFLVPGETYFIEVTATGLTNFTLTSSQARLRQTYQMPATYNQDFADTTAQDLGEGDWAFYGLEIPKDNGALLRTELVTLGGDPNLYLREEGFPTISHGANGNGSLFDRSLTGSDTEYANWVPLDGRRETELRPGRWVLGVRANGTNSRYRLQLSTGDVETLDYASLETFGTLNDPNEITNASVLSNDFRYYRIEIPELPMTPSALHITFTEDAGDLSLHLRDTIPPGHSTQLPSTPSSSIDRIVDADDDDKNRWSYWSTNNSGLNDPGTTEFTFPELRPGAVYFLGMRGRLDGTFDLNVAPSATTVDSEYGGITDLPFQQDGLNITESLAPGASRAYRVTVPAGATRWASSHTHSGNVEVRIEQGTLPVPGSPVGKVHQLLRGANTSFSRTLSSAWPWVPEQDYFLLVTNTGVTAENFSLLLAGKGKLLRLDGWIASFGLTGSAALPAAVNNPLGIPNLIAYAFDLNPLTARPVNRSNLNPIPRLVLSNGSPSFPGLEFSLPTLERPDLCYLLQENSLLQGPWTTLATKAGNGGWIGSGFVVRDRVQSGYQETRIFSPKSLAGTPANFLRLKVVHLP